MVAKNPLTCALRQVLIFRALRTRHALGKKVMFAATPATVNFPVLAAGGPITKNARFPPPIFGPRSWRRPLPAATLRRKNTSRQEEQVVQGLRALSLQCLYRFTINHNKIYHLLTI